MGRANYRGGTAPIRSPIELALLLPVPFMMIVNGHARPIFPGTTRSNASPAVGVVTTKPSRGFPAPRGFPFYIHWKQWEKVVVPLITLDKRVTGWRGTLSDLGAAVTLMDNIVGPYGDITYPAGFPLGLSVPTDQSLGTLYGCDPFEVDRVGGRTNGYLHGVMGIIFTKATLAGF